MAALEVKQHNITVLKELEPGDLVEFERGIYSHWAVYAGEEKVIHLGDLNSNVKGSSSSVFTVCGKRCPKAVVKEDKFWDVACDSKANKNNDKDKKLSPSEADTIIERAMNKIGEKGYNVLWSNCEHFASYCRYGKSKSDQANKFLTWAGTVGSAIIVVIAAVVAIAFGVKPKNGRQK